MNPNKILTSTCRYCRHYKPEGRRGGICNQLGAPVHGTWKACSLALPPFAPSWETLEDAWILPDATPLVAVSSTIVQNLEEALPVVAETTVSTTPQIKSKAVLI